MFSTRLSYSKNYKVELQGIKFAHVKDLFTKNVHMNFVLYKIWQFFLSNSQEHADAVKTSFAIKEVPHLLDGADAEDDRLITAVSGHGKHLFFMSFVAAGSFVGLLVEVGVAMQPGNISKQKRGDNLRRKKILI